jgi:hypothetical protein
VPEKPKRKYNIPDEHRRIEALKPQIIADFPVLGDAATQAKYNIKDVTWKRLKAKLNLHDKKVARNKGGRPRKDKGTAPNPGLKPDNVIISRALLEQNMAKLDEMTARLVEVNKLLDERDAKQSAETDKPCGEIVSLEVEVRLIAGSVKLTYYDSGKGTLSKQDRDFLAGIFSLMVRGK